MSDARARENQPQDDSDQLSIRPHSLAVTIVGVVSKAYFFVTLTFLLGSFVWMGIHDSNLGHLRENNIHFAISLVVGFWFAPLQLFYLFFVYRARRRRLLQPALQSNLTQLNLRAVALQSFKGSFLVGCGHFFLLYGLVSLTSTSWNILAAGLCIVWLNIYSILHWQALFKNITDVRKWTSFEAVQNLPNFPPIIIGYIQKASSSSELETGSWKGQGGGFSGGGASTKF